jgi:hypothetical protein
MSRQHLRRSTKHRGSGLIPTRLANRSRPMMERLQHRNETSPEDQHQSTWNPRLSTYVAFLLWRRRITYLRQPCAMSAFSLAQRRGRPGPPVSRSRRWRAQHLPCPMFYVSTVTVQTAILIEGSSKEASLRKMETIRVQHCTGYINECHSRPS